MSKKFAILSSTGGSVINSVFSNTARSKFDIDLIIVDRECGAAEFARKNKIKLEIITCSTRATISDKVLEILKNHGIDILYLFYTKILSGKILDEFKNRIINFHPSILPACPGLHGFEKTLSSGALIAGSTAHYIDSGIDSGEIILQSFTPVLGVSIEKLRHTIFSQQCASLYFIHQNILNGMPIKKTSLNVFDMSQGFVPNIDQDSVDLYNSILNNFTKTPENNY